MLSTESIASLTDTEDLAAQDRLFTALKSSVRRRILSILIEANGTVAVEELVTYFEFEQATISHHLRMLTKANLVYRRNHGTYHYYSVRRDVLARAQQIIASIGATESLKKPRETLSHQEKRGMP